MTTAIRGLLQTEFDFELPKGYLDEDGKLHREGRMRLATGIDEIAPMRDPRVRANQSYLMIAILARVITRLGDLTEITPEVVEKMYTKDLSYLQEMYQRVNGDGAEPVTATCPKCGTFFMVETGGSEEGNGSGGW